MTQRHVLVEGPDDVAALCELTSRLFACQNEGGPAARSPSRVERVRITHTGVRVQIAAAPNAKDGIPKALVSLFGALPPQLLGDEAYVDRVAFLYDSDGDGPGAFGHRVGRALQSLPGWNVTHEANSERWDARA